MKKTVITIALAVSCSMAFSQISFKTGNAEFDSDLQSINAKAKLDIMGFKVDLNKTYDLPIQKIDELLKIMDPAEVVLANDVAQVSKKPLDDVVTAYKTNKEKGWGTIAKEMGIKPGSPEFHALKGKTKNKADKGKGKSKGPANAAGKGNNGNGKGKNKGK